MQLQQSWVHLCCLPLNNLHSGAYMSRPVGCIHPYTYHTVFHSSWICCKLHLVLTDHMTLGNIQGNQFQWASYFSNHIMSLRLLPVFYTIVCHNVSINHPYTSCFIVTKYNMIKLWLTSTMLVTCVIVIKMHPGWAVLFEAVYLTDILSIKCWDLQWYHNKCYCRHSKVHLFLVQFY